MWFHLGLQCFRRKSSLLNTYLLSPLISRRISQFRIFCHPAAFSWFSIYHCRYKRERKSDNFRLSLKVLTDRAAARMSGFAHGDPPNILLLRSRELTFGWISQTNAPWRLKYFSSCSWLARCQSQLGATLVHGRFLFRCLKHMERNNKLFQGVVLTAGIDPPSDLNLLP